jgi:hypothetical protein
MNVKIKIKNKLERNQNCSIGWLNWKENNFNKKKNKKKRIRSKLKTNKTK